MNLAVFQAYFSKFSLRPQLIVKTPAENLGMVVVIPCHNEPDIESAIYSLNKAKEPGFSVEVIVVVNQAESAGDAVKLQNLDSLKRLRSIAAETWFELHLLSELNLPEKHAGVGLSRKIGMDEALRRFSVLSRNGVIACFDADSKVEENYFTELEVVFKQNVSGCNIYFEHRLDGSNALVNEAITDYELFLRYYNLAMNYADLPYGHFTVGSSMAVTCEAYVKVGGMNKRKAGEDFYFLHKIIQLGNFKEVTSTTVFPSSRVSDRVPFGTGKAIKSRLESGAEHLETYPLDGFVLLREFGRKIRAYDLNNWPEDVKSFLPENFTDRLGKIRATNRSQEKYVSGVFQLFNAFQALKFLHFKRDQGSSISLNDAVKELFLELNINFDHDTNNYELLMTLRKIDRKKLYRNKGVKTKA